MLTRAPATLAGWIDAIRDAEIPVLARTVAALDALRAKEDEVAPRDIAEAIRHDPLMTLKLFATISRERPASRVTDTETVTASLLMTGVSRFLRSVEAQACVEDRLAAVPGATDGLARVLRRSHRAARFAIGFALHRLDTDAEVIEEAALLHDFAEALLWCHAPGLALEIARRQAADPALRSAQAQRDVLNVTLGGLEQALMQAWRLPELLRRLTDHRPSCEPRVRNVMLATALARHSQNGWSNPALPADVAALASLLNLSPTAVGSMIRSLDENAVDFACPR